MIDVTIQSSTHSTIYIKLFLFDLTFRNAQILNSVFTCATTILLGTNIMVLSAIGVQVRI